MPKVTLKKKSLTPDHFNYHKTPLLGMANAWDSKAQDTCHPDLQGTVKERK